MCGRGGRTGVSTYQGCQRGVDGFQAVSLVIVVGKENEAVDGPDYGGRQPRRCSSGADPTDRPRRQDPIKQDDESNLERSDAVENEQHDDLESDEKVRLGRAGKGMRTDRGEEARGDEEDGGKGDEGGNVSTKYAVLRVGDVLGGGVSSCAVLRSASTYDFTSRYPSVAESVRITRIVGM